MTVATPREDPIAGLGAVHTRSWVVTMMLDLAGYVDDEDLGSGTAVEPAVGFGAFLVPMIERLIASCRRHGRPISTTGSAIVAYDLDPRAVEESRRRASVLLRAHGLSAALTRRLVTGWVRHGDFLLEAPALSQIRWVIGNPPYVRVEDVGRERLLSYRALWSTMRGRADVYVGFLQAGLEVLADDATMTTICADRWMRNQYGATLRSVISQRYAVDACISMYGSAAFETPVAVYPAITVMRNGTQRRTLLFDREAPLDQDHGATLLHAWRQGPADTPAARAAHAQWTRGWHAGPAGWPTRRSARVTAAERRLPTLAEAGVHVSMGPATGADTIYVTHDTAGIETERLIPAIGAQEVRRGELEWIGRHLINPWDDDGLVDLGQYPGLKRYVERHRPRLLERHTARAHPDQWWRTIDRVRPQMAATPKLLIPDIKERIFPVLDNGQFLPMHNLYYVVAPTWDLRVLGGILMSDIATQFVSTYSVRMASGYFRVSAQYLRRVRIPAYPTIPPALRRQLRTAFDARDLPAANDAANRAYDLRTA
ncbi:Eco57I restriction-modification methylase domain-containing protein [Mycolicibacterium arabiense]|uniref:Eco57I restriction-modification methylase domain-containing protein n=1 Tax=Mycolicibacterium arabiense TaxID=1286181 RepID=UPI0013D1303E|nr:Eco57I restriction-modification methylase domain-containing protein [Mycolicibacterium arabiense]MCV7372049.1 Eco57I restriction-modification methylase domain-containing protein [Mycolicibacterium arabiense]